MEQELLQVIHHKYYDMLRRKYQKPTVVIGDGFDVADERDFLEDMLHRVRVSKDTLINI